MNFSIVISSTNYNGQVANITFYPVTGGSINIGTHTIPYTYITDFYYGEYNIHFSNYNKTCKFIIEEPKQFQDNIYFDFMDGEKYDFQN